MFVLKKLAEFATYIGNVNHPNCAWGQPGGIMAENVPLVE